MKRKNGKSGTLHTACSKIFLKDLFECIHISCLNVAKILSSNKFHPFLFLSVLEENLAVLFILSKQTLHSSNCSIEAPVLDLQEDE